MYFTPPDVSAVTLAEVVRAYRGDVANARILDPCSGGGAFLAPLVRLASSALAKSELESLRRINCVAQNLHGFDIDDDLIRLSRVFMLIELHNANKLTGDVPFLNVGVRDSLLEPPPFESFDIVVGNPPFRKLTAEEKHLYREGFSDSANGGSNLYGMFITQSVRFVRPGGLVCLIIPGSLFAGRYFQRLRSQIGKDCDVVSVHMMEKRAGTFSHVQQETAILTLKRRESQRRLGRPAKTRMYSLDDSCNRTLLGKIKLPHSGAPWITPKTLEQAPLAQVFDKGLPTLTDYGYEIKTGSVVWNRDTRARFSVPKSPNSRSRTVPLIWSEAVSLCGKFDFHRAKDRAGGELYIRVRNDSEELINGPAVAVKRTNNSSQDRRLYTAPIPGNFAHRHDGYVAENHVYLIVPSGSDTQVGVSMLSRILNTRAIDQMYRCLAGTSAVSKYELELLPLPDSNDFSSAIAGGMTVEQAVAKGYGMRPV